MRAINNVDVEIVFSDNECTVTLIPEDSLSLEENKGELLVCLFIFYSF